MYIFLSLFAFVFTAREMLVNAFLDAADARAAVERTVLAIYQDAGETITDAELAEYIDCLPMSISRASLESFVIDIDDGLVELGVLIFSDSEFRFLLESRARLLSAYLLMVADHAKTELVEKN